MDPTAHQYIELNGGADLQGFRQALRILTWSNIPHEQITWSVSAAPDLFGGGQLPAAYGSAGRPIILPRDVGDLIKLVVCHTEPQKYALLYELVWRMRRPHDPELRLYEVASDPLVHRLNMMAKSVRRDLHKMHVFLRFREVNDLVVGERFVAWFEPEHFIVEETAQFFVDRFTSLDWTILTPKGSLWWDRIELAIGPPAQRSDAPETDAFEIGWRTYYQSTFNPARTNLNQMRQHMPKKYWRNLPETQAIPGLVNAAASRVDEMIERETMMPIRKMPAKAIAALTEQGPASLAELNRIISASDPFLEGSNKAVLGEGPLHPAIAFVGEQPGDLEDLQVRPFVGPAGQIFRQGARGSRHRPPEGLRHQRRQTRQIRPARQAPHPPVPHCRRDRALPLVAPERAGFCPAKAGRRPRRVRRPCAGGEGSHNQPHPRPAQIRRFQPPTGLYHRPPLLFAASAFRRRPRPRVYSLRSGPEACPRPGPLISPAAPLGKKIVRRATPCPALRR